MKTWIFGTYNWQGNPKALFIYMNKHYKETHELWWIADDEEVAEFVSTLGYKATYLKSGKAQELFARADVYVNENFREYYPESINTNCKIFNLWHGVGLKHVEFGVGMNSGVTKNIIRKYTKNYSLLKNNTKFLVTSNFMNDHFKKDMRLSNNQIVKGVYPRNEVYKDSSLRTFNINKAYGINMQDFKEIILYAPTWRNTKAGVFKKLIPDIERLNSVLKNKNSLLFIKVHPQTKHDYSYIEAYEKTDLLTNIIFWDDYYDVYEVFDQIDIGIIDYSSILYDMIDAGINKFVRYTPDYENYIRESELIADYDEYTDGQHCNTFRDLLNVIDSNIERITKEEFLNKKFFEYKYQTNIDNMIQEVESSSIKKEKFKDLHTFDIFDTILRRKTLSPFSIFYKVQKEIKHNKELEYPKYLVDCYPSIRHQVEIDLRDVYKKTLYERNTDKIEIKLRDVFDRLQENYELTDEQIKFLYETEISEEIDNIEGIDYKKEEFFNLRNNGSEVYLISDMYLPKETIIKMLYKVDSRFVNCKLYLSSEIGYQKSTGKLYEYIFFDCDYNFNKWIHHGDNKIADGTVPRKYGIKTFNHDMDSFIGLENYIINNAPTDYKWDSYKIATAIQRYRMDLLKNSIDDFDEKLYYSFAYIGTAFVPYIYWTINHAIKKRYKTLYFISRDGYFLKKIADVLISKLDLKINTKYIYGSRKSWRVPSFVKEVDPASFSSFGMFTNMNNFNDLVNSSQLEEEELLELLPELKGFKDIGPLKGNVAQTIRNIFEESEEYKKRLLEIATKKRKIVKEYLKQEIDFDEKFAFVEFWGRGYTQDTLTRILEDITEKDFENPFYYIRNFTPNYGKSIRHRFTTIPSNFSYFESVFAQTPYKSISGYKYENNKVVPIIENTSNEFFEKINQGIKDFAQIFSELSKDFEEGFYRYISEASYKYQFDNPNDKFISNVFARFKDNIAMYGETVEYAPEFTMQLIENIGLHNLRYETKNMRMSFARSEDSVQNYLNDKLKTTFKKQSNNFISNPLKNYVFTNRPFFIRSLKDQSIFQSINWKQESKANKIIKKNDIIKVEYVEWASTGVPRLKTSDGYITANKNYVEIIEEYKDIEFNKPIPIFTNLEDKDYLMFKRNLKILNIELFNGDYYLLTEKGYIKRDKEFYKSINNEESLCFDKNHETSELKSLENKTKSLNLKKSKENYNYIRLVGNVEWSNEFGQIKEESYNKKFQNKIVKVDNIIEDENTNKKYFKVGNRYLLADKIYYNKVRNDIFSYYHHIISPYLIIKKDLYIYNSVIFNNTTRTKKKIKRFSLVKPKSIQWTGGGTPRIELNSGYISANKNFVIFIKGVNLFTIMKNKVKNKIFIN